MKQMIKSRKEDTMSLFTSKRPALIKNEIPITLKMLDSINPISLKIDDIIEVSKLVIIANIISVTPVIGDKVMILVRDQTLAHSKSIHMFIPKQQEQTSLFEGEYYKFICSIRADHGQIIMSCTKCTKILDYNELTYHLFKVMMAYTYRKKILNNANNQKINQSQPNQFDLY